MNMNDGNDKHEKFRLSEKNQDRSLKKFILTDFFREGLVGLGMKMGFRSSGQADKYFD